MSKYEGITLTEFFRGKPSCEQIVQCVYDLNTLEFNTYCTLLQLNEGTVSKLMKIMEKKERTLLNRALKNLLDKKLVIRETRSKYGKRGYWFVYKPKSLDNLKKDLLVIIDKWYLNSTGNIHNIKERFAQKYDSDQLYDKIN